MNWSLRDAIFTGRSFRDYDALLEWEWKIYYRREGGGNGAEAILGSLLYLALGSVSKFPGAFCAVLSHHRAGVCFSLRYKSD